MTAQGQLSEEAPHAAARQFPSLRILLGDSVRCMGKAKQRLAMEALQKFDDDADPKGPTENRDCVGKGGQRSQGVAHVGRAIWIGAICQGDEKGQTSKKAPASNHVSTSPTPIVIVYLATAAPPA